MTSQLSSQLSFGLTEIRSDLLPEVSSEDNEDDSAENSNLSSAFVSETANDDKEETPQNLPNQIHFTTITMKEKDADVFNFDETEFASVEYSGQTDQQQVCAYCHKATESYNFRGRFCSQTCVAKHANWHRQKIHPTFHQNYLKGKKRRLSQFELHSKHKPGKLKLQIPRRLSAGAEAKYFGVKSTLEKRICTTSYHSSAEVSFSWEQYLKSENAEAVPCKVFNNLTHAHPYPIRDNLFQVGWLLEAVDPLHQSLITLVSVAATLGQRLRLHFEGFPSMYDFWIYHDSPLIFPCGYCEKTGRSLTPPLGFEPRTFDWRSYASINKLKVAPAEAFSNVCYENNTGFPLNCRLEAVDKQHPELICVATVVDAIGELILVHFDGWNSYYDYWTLKTSNYIKPVGWCAANDRELSPPLNSTDTTFTWSEYLHENKFSAADPALFASNCHGFKSGTKLEVVDPRNPIIIRVASIAQIDEHRVQVHFDGWDHLYDVWISADDRDLHPINYSLKSGETLLTPLDLKKGNQSEFSFCPVPNCLGHGHFRHGKYVNHYSEFGCPYSAQNLNRDPLPDRFLNVKTSSASYDDVIADANNNTKPNAIIVSKKKRGRPRGHSQTSRQERRWSKESARKSYSGREIQETNKRQQATKERSVESNHNLAYEASFINSLMEKSDEADVHISWKSYVFSLPELKGKTASDIQEWSVEQVSSFVESLTGKHEHAKIFATQEIDGKAFLMLSQSDITSILKLKLGPGLKIFSAILCIRGSLNRSYAHEVSQ